MMREPKPSALEMFWEIMDYCGPPPPMLAQIRPVLRGMIEEGRLADAMVIAVMYDRERQARSSPAEGARGSKRAWDEG